MWFRPSRALWVLCTLAWTACGRIGVEFLTEDERSVDATVAEVDGSEPAWESTDASMFGVDDAEPQPDVGEDAAPPTSEWDANGDSAASAPDADIRDAGGLSDAQVPEAAAPIADCRMTVGGIEVDYRTGDVGTLQGTHLLQLVDTGLCALPAACGADHGGDVVQGSCSTIPCQMWDSFDAGSGWFSLRNANNGACLYMSSTGDGTNAVNWECFAGNQVRWQAVCAGDDTWHLVNELSGKRLGGNGAGSIVQSAQTSAAQQRWRIVSNPAAVNVVLSSGENSASATWRYTTSSPASNWTGSSFDDGSWSSGAGAFGDGDRGFTPRRTPWSSGEIWLRRSFSLSSIPATLSLKIFHDEGAEVFINGVMVTMLTGWSQGYRNIVLPGSVMSSLVVGNNVIAVHCRSTTAPQFIDVGLVTYNWQ